MNILFQFFLFVITISKIKSLDEWLTISTRNPADKVNVRKVNIARRFVEDLDDYEWHIAHLRTAVFDGRRACASDTFADKVKRYRRMLKEDAAKVDYVSAAPLPVDPENLVEESCEIKDNFDDLINKAAMNVTSANFVEATTVSLNVTSANTTDTMKAAETTPKLDFKATTVELKEKPKKLEGMSNNTRRASEYMFSSVEYYDESIEFDANTCPDAVEIIGLQIDQIRSYDLECELMVEWRSLD